MIFDVNFIIFALVGFCAQLVDGALGMAYGVTSNSLLLGMGISPAIASASVHIAEVFTSGVSGFSHFRLGNIDKKIFKKLLIPGIIGGVLGAYLLTSVPGKSIKPFIAAYLLIMGVRILWRAIKNTKFGKTKTKLFPLGLAGGFFDAIGGGGWGPIVTSTLIANGNHPRFTIGSVNCSEFFVTLAQATTFLVLVKTLPFNIILGLILGGILAAPLAAIACKKVPAKKLMFIVGLLIIGLSIRTIFLCF